MTHRQIFSDPYLFGTPQWQSFILVERKSRPGPAPPSGQPLSTVSGHPPSFSLSHTLSLPPSCGRHQSDVASIRGCEGKTANRLRKSINGGRKPANVGHRSSCGVELLCGCAAKHSWLGATASATPQLLATLLQKGGI